MKKTILKITSASLVITLLSFSACDSNKEKETPAKEETTKPTAAASAPAFQPQGVSVFKSKVKNGGGNPDYEIFSDLQKDKKELTVAIVQTFSAEEGKDGGPGSDVDVVTITLPDLDATTLQPTSIVTENEIFKDTAYRVYLSSKDNKEVFKSKYISRAGGQATDGTTFSVTLYFNTKKAAEDFLTVLK